jgi:hypothetical protein
MSAYCDCCRTTSEFIREHLDPYGVTEPNDEPANTLARFQRDFPGENIGIGLADVVQYINEIRRESNSPIRYQAHWRNRAASLEFRTRWYKSPEDAQDALMKHREIGFFQYLGRVCGDGYTPGNWGVDWAPRNGGAVTIFRRED